MKKRILAFVLATITALSLVGCSAKEEKPQVKTEEYVYYYTSDSGEYKSGDVSSTFFVEYDKDGNIIRSEHSAMEEANYEVEWKKDGDILRGVASTGEILEKQYDKNDNVKTETGYDSEGNKQYVSEYEYKNGNLEKLTEYDSEGNVTSVKEYEYKDDVLVASKTTGYNEGEESYFNKSEYDANGNITYYMREQNKQKVYEQEYDNVYDEDGKLTSVFTTDILDSIDYVDKYEYDEDGHLKTIIYGRGGTRVDVECDEDGNVIEKRYYNRDGKLETQVLTTYYED